VALDQGGRDAEAEAGASRLAGERAVDLGEAAEDVGLVGGIDADAAIDDVEEDLTAGRLDLEPDRLPGLRELDRIGEQVRERAHEPAAIDPDAAGPSTAPLRSGSAARHRPEPARRLRPARRPTSASSRASSSVSISAEARMASIWSSSSSPPRP
jgi:hypothetical protein